MLPLWQLFCMPLQAAFSYLLDVLFGSCTEFGYVCGRTYGSEDGLDGSWLRVWTHVTWLAELDEGLD